MKPFDALDNDSLDWVPLTSEGFGFELLDGGDTVGRLIWDRQRRSVACAECASGRWTFRRSGFIYPRVTVREAGSARECAVFTPRWRGDGALEITEQCVYHFRPADFWWTRAAFFGPRVEKLLGLEVLVPGSESTTRAAIGRLRVFPPGHGCPHLPLLALVGWFLVMVRRAEAPAPSPIPLVADAPAS